MPLIRLLSLSLAAVVLAACATVDGSPTIQSDTRDVQAYARAVLIDINKASFA